jgi:hypothetical protein
MSQTDQCTPLQFAASHPPVNDPTPPTPTNDDVIPTDMPLQHVLVEEAMLLRSELRDCLARVQRVLVRAEDALGKLQVVSLVPELHVGPLENVKMCASWDSIEHESYVVGVDDAVARVAIDNSLEESSVVEEECIFGCFSPRVGPCLLSPVGSVASECEDIAVIMAPVMQIMPELQELCKEPSPPSLMVHPQVNSLGISAVASTPPQVDLSQPLDFVDLGGKVNEKDALSSEALFAKELCDLLVSLEAAIPGSSKEIASILTEKATMDKVKKVEAYLHSRSMKSGATMMTSVVD